MLFAPRLGFGGRGAPSYSRRAPLILINGLAEQAESWYCNLDANNIGHSPSPWIKPCDRG